MREILPALFLLVWRIGLLSVFLLASCNHHDPTRLIGKNGTEINLGGIRNFAAQGYLNAGFDKLGNPRITIRDNSEAVAIRAVDSATALGGGLIYAGVEKAKDASAAAVAINESKQVTKQAGIAAGVAEAGIAAETTKAITIPK